MTRVGPSAGCWGHLCPDRRTARQLYYDPANPQGSVKHPQTGTQIRIKSISAQDSFMQVEVRPAK